MRNRLVLLGTVGLVAALTLVALPAVAGEAEVQIPFSFAVNGETLGPATYRVTLSVTNGLLQIRNFKESILAMTVAAQADDPTERKLVFHRYGDRYLLREVCLAGWSWQLPEPDEERELMRSGRLASMEVVEVPAT